MYHIHRLTSRECAVFLISLYFIYIFLRWHFVFLFLFNLRVHEMIGIGLEEKERERHRRTCTERKLNENVDENRRIKESKCLLVGLS